MVWQRIDDQFGVHRKVIRIPKRQRFAAVGLWTLAANYAVRALTDGVLEEHELDELDAPAPLIAELIRVQLWHGPDFACESRDCNLRAPAGGVVIHDFLAQNPSKAEILAQREAERLRKASWRESKRSPGGTDVGTPPGSDPESGHPVPGPVPNPSPTPDKTDHTHDSEVRPEIPARADLTFEDFLVEDARTLGIKSIPRVVSAVQGVVGVCSPAIALDVARAVILLANDPVRWPEAYLEKTRRETPATIRDEYARVMASAPKAVLS